MKICQHMSNGETGPYCRIGVTPMKCKRCESFQLKLFPDITPMAPTVAPKKQGDNAYPVPNGAAILAKSIITGGCGCGRR